MCPVLLHIYGPFAINAYGFFIAVGLLTALFLARKDPRKKHLITDDQGITLLTGGIIAGILGGRILHLLISPELFTSWYNLIAFWDGGFAELGSIMGITIFMILYLMYQKIALLPFMDLAALYVPLIQGFTRIGCFFAGCCYGAPTNVAWGVLYTHPLSLAPLHITLHPTQLYASALCFLLFFLMKLASDMFKKPGQLSALYFMGAGFIRFSVDFWRNDRIFAHTTDLFSSYQYIALGMFAMGLLFFIITSYRKQA